MVIPRALRYLLLLLLAAPAAAYNYPEHETFASAAVTAVCARDASSPLCTEIKGNLPFLLHGAAMEDEAAKGYKEIFNGVAFRDEEPSSAYGPCREYVLAGKTYMYCNHYFFVRSYLAGGPEGSCGRSMLGATDPACEGDGAFRWESARQRGLRLWKEKVIPYYYGSAPDSKARAYYWLGRVAHLLADVSVPAHLLPHTIGYVEFEHRSYEYEAAHTGIGPLPAVPVPGDLNGLFEELAKNTLETHDAVRAGECRRDPGVAGCDKMRASPSRPLESSISLRNIKLTNDLIGGKPGAVGRPEILSERVLARRQLAVVKPLTMLFTVRMLELFGEQAALTPLPVAVPQPRAEELRSPLPDLCGALR